MLLTHRLNARDRGYDERWKRTRTQFLWQHTWCCGCLAIGVKTKATVVDHVIPHRGDQRLFWDRNNWQPACAWHHNSIKPELERLYEARKILAADLHLQSSAAARLTRERHRPAIGVDGFPIPGS